MDAYLDYLASVIIGLFALFVIFVVVSSLIASIEFRILASIVVIVFAVAWAFNRIFQLVVDHPRFKCYN